MSRSAAFGLLVIVAFFALASPLVDLDGDPLTVDTPTAVLAPVGTAASDQEPGEEAQPAADERAGQRGRATRRPAQAAVAAFVAVRWALFLRRWHRGCRGGTPR